MRKSISLALALASLPAIAMADDVVAGDLTVTDAYAYASARSARTGAGYMTLTNSGDTDRSLVAAEADFPRVELHESLERDGVMIMEHQMAVVIPAGESVSFVPGGLHVMFMGLDAPLEPGEDIPATLVFEDGTRVDLTFSVRERE